MPSNPAASARSAWREASPGRPTPIVHTSGVGMNCYSIVMHDLVIRGGTVVDGTGSPAVTADVAISDGVITEVGSIEGGAARVIEADGLLVTPGFVDVHTHYDGQATWDELLSPSCWHGVT